jgi:hypothetical protein
VFTFGFGFGVRGSGFEVRGSQFLRASPIAGFSESASPTTDFARMRHVSDWHSPCSSNCMSRGVRRFTQLRAWQACVDYKKAVYAICEVGPLAKDTKRRAQLEDSVAGPPGHIAEGFGRVHRKYIDEGKRQEVDGLAQVALQEVTGLMEYLQSPEALRNARRARERRIASRQERRETGTPLANIEQGTENPEPEPEPEPNRESEHEPSSENREE